MLCLKGVIYVPISADDCPGLVVSEGPLQVHELGVDHVAKKILAKRDGEIGEDSGAHKVIEVRLESGERFILDITGPQFGWNELIVPVQRYMQERVKEAGRPLVPISDYCAAIVASKSVDRFGLRLQKYYQKLETFMRDPDPSLYQSSPIQPDPDSRDDAAVEAWLSKVVTDYVRRIRTVVQYFDGVPEERTGRNADRIAADFNGMKLSG
ncbi:hypothetical protein BDZ85DRAFT_117705 [Elsinoe ampelina]|uniref:Uncharacterized protein n=1 Tax=Elsinoe ampelina TaxID=302913 RepID=A0A6A6GAQ3_9PEZI|nr:hypothetical protein BDZ85DRAFT_117705 [Elsinoe ampelina]